MTFPFQTSSEYLHPFLHGQPLLELVSAVHHLGSQDGRDGRHDQHNEHQRIAQVVLDTELDWKSRNHVDKDPREDEQAEGGDGREDREDEGGDDEALGLLATS